MADAARFRDRVVIVTGGASSIGFGRAIADRFAAEGAAVLVADIDEAGAARAAEQIEKDGGRALALATDVSRSADVERMIGSAVDAFGRLDVIVNNAGIPHRSMLMTDLPEEDYDRVFAVNTKSVYLAAVHGIPVLKEQGGGVIVNVASIGGIRPRPGMTAYNATKGAVITMTRGMAAEFARFGIRVNAVNPLASDTGFMKGALGVDSLPDEARDRLAAEVPLRRLTQPSDVATAVTFLASDEAEFLTGVCLDVDGGKGI